MIIGTPAPFVRAFVEAVDNAVRELHPSHAMSATQRAWLACCVTAVLITHSIGWARVERASLGTYSLAALSGMQHRKIPGTNSWWPVCGSSCGTMTSHGPPGHRRYRQPALKIGQGTCPSL